MHKARQNPTRTYLCLCEQKDGAKPIKYRLDLEKFAFLLIKAL
jgi:uncharacterized protein YlaI